MSLYLGTAFIRIRPDITSFNTGLTAAMTAGMGPLTQAASRAGMGLTLALTAPLVGISAIALNESIKFESAFTGVRKTVNATEAEFAVLRDGIINMANVMPASREEIAATVEAAGRFGIANEDLLAFTETAIKLGVSTNLSADKAAESLTRLANIVKLPGDQFDNLGASIVALGNDFPTTEAEIANFARRLAGAGTVAGLTTPEILGFSAALPSLGIRAEAGGTAFSRVFINMNSAVLDGGEALKGFADVAGTTSDEFGSMFKDNPTEAVLQFIEGIERLNSEGANTPAILKDIGLGEIRVRDALLRSAGNTDLMREAVEKANVAWMEGTALNIEAGKRFGTTESQIKIFKNQLGAVALTLGDALLPAFNATLRSLGPLIDMLQSGAHWFAGLDAGMQETIVTIAGAAAAIGPVLVIGTRLFSVFKTIGMGLAALMSPWTLVILAIAGAAYLIYRNWDTLMKWWEKAWPTILLVAQVTWEWIEKNIPPILEAIKKTAMDVFGWLQKNVPPVWERILEVVKTVAGWLKDNMPKAWEAVKNAVVTAVNAIIPVVQGFWDKMKEVGNWFAATFGPGIMKIWESLKENIPPIIDGIVDIFTTFVGRVQGIVEILRPVVEGVVKILGEVFGTLVDFFKPIVTAIIDLLVPFMESVVSTFKNGWETAKGIIEGVWTAISGVVAGGIEVIKGIIDVIAGVFTLDWERTWSGIKSIFSGVWEGMKGIVNGAITIIKSVLSGAWAEITNVATTAWEGLKTMVAGVFQGIVDTASGLPNRLWGVVSALAEAGVGMGKAILEGIGSGLSGVASFAADIGEAVMSAFRKAWNSFVDKLNSGTPNKLDIPKLPWDIDLPDNPWSFLKMHTGGIVPGMMGREVPAVLQAGEGVFTREQMRALGTGAANGKGNGTTFHVDSITVGKPDDLAGALHQLNDEAWKMRVAG